MFRWLCTLIVIALVCLGNVAGGAEKANSLQLTLPPTCYAVVGVPISIYYDNIVLTEKPEQCNFKIECNLGVSESRQWTLTPAAGDVGDHVISVSVSGPDGTPTQQGKLVLHVAPADAGANRAIRLLVVGDSLTHASIYPNEMARLLSQPGNPTWTMLGTHRPAGAAGGVVHEGYGGWTWEQFVQGKGSPFARTTDGGKPAINLDQYFKESCADERPDFVTFMLGINDCFYVNPDDPAAIDARIDAVFRYADKLIAAFRQTAPKAQLGICLTTPPNARESGFEANYQGKFHRWGWKRIQHRLVQRQLEHFGNREAEQIFIVPTELNLDPVDGYPVDNGVHPNDAGYQQIGASVFAWLKSRL